VPRGPRSGCTTVAASAVTSACAPLSPILLLLCRISVAMDALLPTPSARCAAPAAVIPQDTRCRTVRVLLSTIASPSLCAPLSPILLLPYRFSINARALGRWRILTDTTGNSSRPPRIETTLLVVVRRDT
jgi:hypothetical protein